MQKTLVITGGTSGIGRSTVEDLALEGWKIVILARNEGKAKEVQSTVTGDIDFIHCDLSDLSSVSLAAKLVREKYLQIDVLLNNAGAMFIVREESVQGHELSFAQNHLGHFLLTTEIMDVLLQSNARVINVSSTAHKMGRLDFEDLNWKSRRYSGIRAYGDSKLANIYFTKELHNRFNQQGLTAYALHPGVVGTGFGQNWGGIYKRIVKLGHLFMIGPKTGAKTQIHIATKEGIEKHSGKYFAKSKPVKTAKQANEAEPANQLWAVSEELVSAYRS
ncbi:MAG: SDR family oxidoreductase [Cyclobacteriaceae bacterium]